MHRDSRVSLNLKLKEATTSVNLELPWWMMSRPESPLIKVLMGTDEEGSYSNVNSEKNYTVTYSLTCAGLPDMSEYRTFSCLRFNRQYNSKRQLTWIKSATVGIQKLFFVPLMVFATLYQLQWGSMYRSRPVFKWSYSEGIKVISKNVTAIYSIKSITSF